MVGPGTYLLNPYPDTACPGAISHLVSAASSCTCTVFPVPAAFGLIDPSRSAGARLTPNITSLLVLGAPTPHAGGKGATNSSAARPPGEMLPAHVQRSSTAA